MHNLPAFMASAIVGLSALATPAAAQTFEHLFAQCTDERGRPAEGFDACAALLQSGRLDSQQRSVIYAYRATRWQRYGGLVQALADYNEAIRLNPQYHTAYLGRGKLFLEMGNPDRAIADLNEAILLSPQNGYAHYIRGVAFHDQGDFGRAVADHSEAIRLNPQFADAYNGRANAHDRLGDTSRAGTDRAQAARLQGR